MYVYFQEILTMRDILSNEFEFIDIVVNNAGLTSYKTIFEQSSDDIETLTIVKLNLVIFASKYICSFKSIKFIQNNFFIFNLLFKQMIKCVIEKMIENGTGHIVSISST